MRKPWLLLTANLLIAVLVVLIVYAILNALGAMAAYVTTWPLFVLLGLGFLVSFFAFRSLRGVRTRILGLVLNGAALTLYALLTCFIGWQFLSATRERFILPQGYQGEVYVVHSVPGGAPPERSFFGTITYRIPSDGVLLSQVPISTYTRSEYFYESKDGKLTKIEYA
ncbi:MAG: hypothetical protein ABR910_15440 [Acidobacteriaceae bacterium]|jgi:hypothetical protein